MLEEIQAVMCVLANLAFRSQMGMDVLAKNVYFLSAAGWVHQSVSLTAFQATSVRQARDRFKAWRRWVRTDAEALTSGLLAPTRQAADMLELRLEGILGHWQQGLTTGFLEGLNRLFSATKRKARGYRSIEYQTAMLYFVPGKLEIPYYG